MVQTQLYLVLGLEVIACLRMLHQKDFDAALTYS